MRDGTKQRRKGDCSLLPALMNPFFFSLLSLGFIFLSLLSTFSNKNSNCSVSWHRQTDHWFLKPVQSTLEFLHQGEIDQHSKQESIIYIILSNSCVTLKMSPDHRKCKAQWKFLHAKLKKKPPSTVFEKKPTFQFLSQLVAHSKRVS